MIRVEKPLGVILLFQRRQTRQMLYRENRLERLVSMGKADVSLQTTGAGRIRDRGTHFLWEMFNRGIGRRIVPVGNAPSPGSRQVSPVKRFTTKLVRRPLREALEKVTLTGGPRRCAMDKRSRYQAQL